MPNHEQPNRCCSWACRFPGTCCIRRAQRALQRMHEPWQDLSVAGYVCQPADGASDLVCDRRVRRGGKCTITYPTGGLGVATPPFTLGVHRATCSKPEKPTTAA